MNLNDSLKIVFGGDEKKTPTDIPQQTDSDCDIFTLLLWITIEFPHTHTDTKRERKTKKTFYLACAFRISLRWEMDEKRESERDVQRLSQIEMYFVNLYCNAQAHAACTHALSELLLKIHLRLYRASCVSSEIKCLIKWHDYLLSFICIHTFLKLVWGFILPWLLFLF